MQHMLLAVVIAPAGALTGMSAVYQLIKLVGIDLAFHNLANLQRHLRQADQFALVAAVGHVAAGHHNGGDVAAGGSHQMAGHDGVAGAEEYHAVEHVGFHVEFHFIRDEVAAGQLV